MLENWQESAKHINGVAGAFFTPQSLARDLAIEVSGKRIIDLCAGIGALSFAVYHRYGSDAPKMVCIENNPDYVAVGRKVLPEAEWIIADVLDLPAGLGRFDFAIANPPFGRIEGSGHSPRFRGSDFELKVMDVASDIANDGVFLIPQTSCPFRFSGRQMFEPQTSEKYEKFRAQTGIEIGMNCGIDTVAGDHKWHGGAVPVVEIACIDFLAARTLREQAADLAGARPQAAEPVMAFVPGPEDSASRAWPEQEPVQQELFTLV